MDPAEGKAHSEQEDISREADIRARRNQSASPLLRLPAEIRNIIYTYSLGGLEIYLTQTGREGGSYVDITAPGVIWYEKVHVLALSQTCRQTHSDTALLIFSLNRIIISRSPYSINSYVIESRLSLVQRGAIEDLRIETYHSDSLMGHGEDLASFVRLKRITVAVAHSYSHLFNRELMGRHAKRLVGDDVQVTVSDDC